MLVFPALWCFALSLPAGWDLPVVVRAELDSAYPGWRQAGAAAQIREWFAQSMFGHQPDLITADFDSDGATDYALRILSPAGRHITLAFLDRRGRFARHLLAEDPADPFVYLLLFRKGTKDFDFEAMKPFRYARDAVAVMYFDRTPLVFSYSKGAFRKKVLLSDEEH